MPGVNKVLGPEDQSYYTARDVSQLLGVSQTKAYDIIRTMRKNVVLQENSR